MYNRSENICPHMTLYMNVHSNSQFIHNCQAKESIQWSVNNEQMNKEWGCWALTPESSPGIMSTKGTSPTRVSSHPATVQCGSPKAWTHFRTTLKSHFNSRDFHEIGWILCCGCTTACLVLPTPAAFFTLSWVFSQAASSGNSMHSRFWVYFPANHPQTGSHWSGVTAEAGSAHSQRSVTVAHPADSPCVHLSRYDDDRKISHSCRVS